MSIEVLTSIWGDPPVGGGELLCLLALGDNSDDNGFSYPSIRTIARKAKLTRRGAQKCLRRLQDAALICIEPGTGRGNTNGYQLTTCGYGQSVEHQKDEHSSPPLNDEQSSPITAERVNNRTIKGEPQFTRTVIEPSEEEKSPPSIPPDDVSEAVVAYNAEAAVHGWARCGKLTAARRSRLKARLRDCDGLDGWQSALIRARGSPFLRGEVNGFRLGLDFLLQESSFTKLMEGFYDHRHDAAPNSGFNIAAAGAEIARRL